MVVWREVSDDESSSEYMEEPGFYHISFVQASSLKL